MVRRYVQGRFGVISAKDGDFVKYEDYTQALAEKDLQWKRRVGLDCGGHSCFYAIEKTGMRHNGPCSCKPKQTKEDHDRLYVAYQQLMAQAVRFARVLEQIANEHGFTGIETRKFLDSSEAQAFLKEKEGTR